jgi:RNA polymerase-interacting CarD/CdnL/TRCF family regulator
METDGQNNFPRSMDELTPGSFVIYSLHGKCQFLGTEVRKVGETLVEFYKLSSKVVRGSTKAGSAIWVPRASAKEKGLRPAMSSEEAENALQYLLNREYYFKLNTPWSEVITQLEQCIHLEGGIGLAKAYSYLYVLRKKERVPSVELNKLYDTVYRLFFKELADALRQTPRALEERVAKGLRSKLLPDH